MNYSRTPDELLHKFAHQQAYLFEKSALEGIPSYFFIKVYMHLDLVEKLDQLSLVPDDELYFAVKRHLKNKRGIIYDSNVIHWMGYIYRTISYLYKIPSSLLFKKVSPKYLYSIYPLAHSLDPRKAASNIYEKKLKEETSNTEKIMRILRETI